MTHPQGVVRLKLQGEIQHDLKYTAENYTVDLLVYALIRFIARGHALLSLFKKRLLLNLRNEQTVILLYSVDITVSFIYIFDS